MLVMLQATYIFHTYVTKEKQLTSTYNRENNNFKKSTFFTKANRTMCIHALDISWTLVAGTLQ